MRALADEYMNPNHKESLPREWWQTSFQILPTDDVMQKIKDNDPKYTVLDGSCRQNGQKHHDVLQVQGGHARYVMIDASPQGGRKGPQ